MLYINLFKSESVQSAFKVLDDPRSFKSEFCNTLKNVLDNPYNQLQIQKMKRFLASVYTHCMNVAIIAGMIYFENKTNETTMKEVVSAGLFHDIGKNNIDKNILLSPNKLSEEERRIINTHPKEGYAISKKIMISNQAKQGILSHHEDISGTGYPKHLEGDSIPVVGRILRIADVYDALVSKRSYKCRINPKEVADYIISKEGILFDETYTGLFHKIKNRGVYYEYNIR